MKYFKSPTGEVFAYAADGSQDHAMQPHLEAITAVEAAHLTQPPVSTKRLCAEIDGAADAARAQVAGDPLRAVEYDRAAAEAQAFKAAGYPADAVPRTVAAWAISGRTAQQAADNILLESAAYTEALYQIREARLGAKEMVRQAMASGNVDQAQDIAAETIAAIESAISGIGNARV